MHPGGPTLSGLAATKSLSPEAASGETDIFLMKVDSWCEISGLGSPSNRIVILIPQWREKDPAGREKPWEEANLRMDSPLRAEGQEQGLQKYLSRPATARVKFVFASPDALALLRLCLPPALNHPKSPR